MTAIYHICRSLSESKSNPRESLYTRWLRGRRGGLHWWCKGLDGYLFFLVTHLPYPPLTWGWACGAGHGTVTCPETDIQACPTRALSTDFLAVEAGEEEVSLCISVLKAISILISISSKRCESGAFYQSSSSPLGHMYVVIRKRRRNRCGRPVAPWTSSETVAQTSQHSDLLKPVWVALLLLQPKFLSQAEGI